MAIFFLLASKDLQAQARLNPNADLNTSDTNNTARRSTMTEPDFDLLVNKFVDIMGKGDNIKTISDNIILFRIYNTIDWGPESPNKASYIRFKHLYNEKYSAPTVRTLDTVMHEDNDGEYYFSDGENIGYMRNWFRQKGFYDVKFTGFSVIDTSDISRRLSISDREFNSQINRFFELMQKGDTIRTINDYILVVRLFNTLQEGLDLGKKNEEYDGKKDIYRRFFWLFNSRYKGVSIHKLRCQRKKGHDNWYSYKYAVGINSSSLSIDEKDYYHITAQTSLTQDNNFIFRDTNIVARRFTIAESDFDSLVYRFVDIMEKRHDIKNINDNIMLFRLFNTLDWAPATPNKAIYSRLKFLFTRRYRSPVLHKLDSIMYPTDDGRYSFRNGTSFSFSIWGKSNIGFDQNAYYQVLFKGFSSMDTGNIARRHNISAQEFILQIKRFADIMRKGDTISTNDYVMLLRLSNTLDGGVSYQEKEWEYFVKTNAPTFGRFFRLFRQYWEPAIKKLDCVRRKGGEGSYSFHYGVGMGFSSFFVDKRDFYRVKFDLSDQENLDTQTKNSSRDLNIPDTSSLAYRQTLSQKEFNEQVQRFMKVMKKGDSVKTVNDYLVLIRLDNTMLLGWQFQKYDFRFSDDDILVFRRFDKLFYPRYFARAVGKLNAIRRVDQSYYSPSYDLVLDAQTSNALEKDHYYILPK